VRKAYLTLLLLVTLSLLATPVRAQVGDSAAEFYALVNQMRVDAGLAPYGWSQALAGSAQRHADDLAAHQLASHTGSDGSTPAQRVAEAGYAAWGDGQVVGENFWSGHGTVADALDWFMGDPPHRENILSARYREVGIGVATDAEGSSYYVLDFSARPNVLPVFINDGAATTESAQVAIRLTNEEAYPQGQGTTYVGRALEFRISNTPDFEDLPWQRWEPLVVWTLPEEAGQHTVYVQLRDGAGRTAASADDILLLTGETTPSPASPTATVTPLPPTPALPLGGPSTPTSVPAETPVPLSSPAAAAISPPSPTSAYAAVVTLTPFPTWTPLPPPSSSRASEASGPLVELCVLQAMAILLGAYLALRRAGAQ
jgi:hypothetical protein